VNSQPSRAAVELSLAEAKELTKRLGAAEAAVVVDDVVTLEAVLEAFQLSPGKEVTRKERRGSAPSGRARFL
jgi:hypothetical protein